MPVKSKKRKKNTKNPRSRNTKKSSAYTPTSRAGIAPKRVQLAAERLFRSGLRAEKSAHMKAAIVEGYSMWPELKPGFKVFYRSGSDINIGDVVVLKGKGRGREPRLKVHRILGRVGPYFLEAGDNTFVASIVEPAKILGRVEYAENKRRKIQIQLHDESQLRFRFFRLLAQSFMFTHEFKDRVLGNRKSLILWKLSQAYRGVLHVAGLEVPAIPPR